MIRITSVDFQKLVKLLAKEGQDGAPLSFSMTSIGSSLRISTMDRNNKEMVIELSDVEYPFMPRLIKVETF